MPWTATFDEDGNVTIQPDTPETRAEFHRTMYGIAAGEYDGVRPVPGADE